MSCNEDTINADLDEVWEEFTEQRRKDIEAHLEERRRAFSSPLCGEDMDHDLGEVLLLQTLRDQILRAQICKRCKGIFVI